MYFREFYFQIAKGAGVPCEYLEQQLQLICLRTLIVEMHRYKNSHLLKGKNSKEEYLYFCRDVIGKPEFIDSCFARYPELYRCIQEKIQFVKNYCHEVADNFERDKMEISRELCNREIDKIIKIDGGIGDTHCRGRQVLKLTLDTGEQLLYKPHSLRNEEVLG